MKLLLRFKTPSATMVSAMVVLLLMSGLPVSHAATTITVDDNCSLADAITAANKNTATGGCPAGSGHDIINLTANITLTANLPGITSTMTIQSDDDTVKRIISGDDKRRIFQGNGGARLTLNNLILTNGRAYTPDGEIGNSDKGGAIWMPWGHTLTLNNSVIRNSRAGQGGGIYLNNASLTLNNSRFRNNEGLSGGGAIFHWSSGNVSINNSSFISNSSPGHFGVLGEGGAIHVSLAWVRLTISDSVFKNNSARIYGGAISYHSMHQNSIKVYRSTFIGNSSGGNGGAIYSEADVVENSTFLNNSAAWDGGAIHLTGQGVLRLKHSTLVNNSAGTNGGGIARAGGRTRVWMYNSIISNNTGGDCRGGYGVNQVSAGVFSGDGSCGATYFGDPQAGDAVTTDAGQVYFPLVSGQSRAINNGVEAHCLSADQLGNARPVGSGCDIGAYENPDAVTAATATVTNTPLPPTATPTATLTPLPGELIVTGNCTLADAITAANTDSPRRYCRTPGNGGADEITINGDITLTSALPEITTEITLITSGHTISGNDARRIFTVGSGGHLRLSNVVLTNGRASDGGAIKVKSGGTADDERQHSAE